jgi:protein SCO1
MARLVFILVLAVLAFTAGCRLPSARLDDATPVTETGEAQRVFQVKGIVMEVNAPEKEVEIKHEEIPGYMKAMTMPFEVRDTNELAGLEPGDSVSFRMIVTESEGWIEQIRKLGPPLTNAPPTTGRFRLVRDVEPLNEGDLLPEYRFTNQFGQAISTAQFRGQALAITFIFTRCPFPTFCPLMMENLAAAQNALLSMPDAPKNWHLMTISFDPEFDTPAILKAYAERYKYDPKHWSVVTGELIDITAIAEQFGLEFWREEGAGISHNLRTAVVDPSGRVHKILLGNKWKSGELVEALVDAAKAP